MGQSTAISWAHHTFNPVWGCFEVGPECDNCYARTFAKRVGHGGHWPPVEREDFAAKRGDALMRRVKSVKDSGRELDGVIHDAFPVPA